MNLLRHLDDLRFRLALPLLPLALAASAVGLHLDSALLAVGGLALAGVAAFTLQDDQDPRSPWA